MTRLRKGGDELAWTDIGPLDGDLVVCCHGAGYDGSTFAGLAAALAADGLRVVLPDNRGAGASTDHDGLIARQAHIALVDDLQALLAHLDAGSAILVGHSLGGWTALGTAVATPPSGPGAVAGLVLASTPAGVFTPEVGAFWDGFAARLRDGAPPEAVAALDLLRTSTPSLDEIAAVAGRCPTAFVVGADDPVYPPSVVRAAAAAMPGATVTEAPAAGHLVHLDAPDAVLAAITEVRAGRRGSR